MQGHCKRLGRTLEQECKPDGCKLYFTKKGTTPTEFKGLHDAVAICRARQNAGLSLNNYPIPFWAEKAHMIGTAVYARAEAEMNDPENEDDTIGGGQNTGMQFTGKGDSDAFKLIAEHMAELKNQNT